MLEIRDIQYFEDGSSVVDTIGGKRFKVLSRGVKDGYNTAKVEYLHDEVLEGEDLESKCLKISMFVKCQYSVSAKCFFGQKLSKSAHARNCRTIYQLDLMKLFLQI